MRKRKIVQFKEIVGNSGEVIVGNMCAHCEFFFPLFREQVRKVTGVIRCEKSLFRAFDTKFIYETLFPLSRCHLHKEVIISTSRWLLMTVCREVLLTKCSTYITKVVLNLCSSLVDFFSS